MLNFYCISVEGIDKTGKELIRKYLDILGDRRASLNEWCISKLLEHKAYIREYGEDMPIVKNWKWQ